MTQHLYGIDLTKFSLARFKDVLENEELLPSRQILKERLAERFAVLEAMDIDHLAALIAALKTKKKLAQFAQDSGLPEDYLVILRRQAQSYIPRPVNLKDIPGVDPEHVARLADVGVKHTKHLFTRARTVASRTELGAESGVPAAALTELVQLADLARAGWVGPIFVRLIHAAGAQTLESLAQCAPQALYESMQAVNREQELTKAYFSVKDVAACIETAQELPQVVEYGGG